MNQEMLKIIKEIEENKKVNYNEVFLNLALQDIDILAIITYCLNNKVDEVLQTYDIDYNDFPNYFYSDYDVVEQIENLNEQNYDYDDEMLNDFSKIVFSEAIKNTRINFSINDVNQEGLIAMLKFKNEYYEKLSEKYSKEDIKYIFKNFIKRAMLIYQKKEIENLRNQEYLHLLYIKIKSELNQEGDLETILKRINIDLDFYNKLTNMFEQEDYDLTYDEILEQMDRVNNKYSISLNTNKLSYIEEMILNDYLGLENEKLSLKEISKNKNIKEDVLEEFIKNGIYKVSLVYNKEILDKLNELLKES